MSHVSIRGDGVAGRCCAALLSRAGISINVESANRARLPAIMLSDPARKLIADVFELDRPFDDLPRIRKRIVAWGENQAPVSMEHSGVVVSEEELLRRLGTPPPASGFAKPAWTICAAKPLPANVEEQRFGSRTALAAPVALARDAEPEACWMESLDEGWLFLIANAPGKGWLLAVGETPAELLERSQVVRDAIASERSWGPPFPVVPRIAAPLAGDSWIACGTAAMAFDPICGDGTAHAVREGILASAVVKAALRGGNVEQLLAHYRNRLTAGFLRHLLHCVEFYAPIAGDWWRREAAAAREGIEWCSGRMGGDPAFRYRLNGLELEAVE
jgi:hypothetical protein